uniref:Apoptosis inducing factor mitochondria associated 4 n=1 Tax=Xiphophorus couchianus TaxID=32473 RepID=A0A3B5M0K5_9TELE
HLQWEISNINYTSSTRLKKIKRKFLVSPNPVVDKYTVVFQVGKIIVQNKKNNVIPLLPALNGCSFPCFLWSPIGGRCTHYNAPLIMGTLVGDRVRCPIHGACFNVKTGDIEDYPGLDCLVKSFIICCSQSLKLTKRMKEMCTVNPDVKHIILLVGGGPASLVCAETLRQNCYQGRIIIVTKDNLPPFDKPKLSKVRNFIQNSILLRQHDFYQQHGIEMWMGKEVVSVNSADKVVQMSDGTSQLSHPETCPLQCPGSDLKGVHLLQSYADAKEIHASSLGKRAVVIGASFIGMEAASYLSDKAASVALVGPTKYPFENSLGPEIGKMTMEEKKVKFVMNNKVTEIRGENGKVIQFLLTNVADVFSAGDVASFPLTIRGDQRVNIGHWQMSHAHGRVAALNMLNKPTTIESVPFFWSALAGKSIRYAGYGEGYTEIIIKGKLEERKFVALYIKDEVVVAAASMAFEPAVSRVADLLDQGRAITKTQAQ